MQIKCHVVGIYPPPAILEERIIMYHALRMMANRFLRHIPVVDEQGRLQGLLTIRDVIKMLYDVRKRGEALADVLVAKSVSEYAIRNPVTVTYGEFTIRDVIETMSKYMFGSLPVVTRDNLVLGIITEEHIANMLRHASFLGAAIGVDEVMSKPVKTLRYREATIADAIKLMAEGGFRHVPLIDESGRTVAIVTARDVIRFLTRSEVLQRLENYEDESVFSTPVSQVARLHPVRLSVESTVQELLELMAVTGVSGVVIEKDSKPTGIVTDIDLVTRLPRKLGDTLYEYLERVAPPCPG